MPFVFYFFIFFLGASLGSFLNVAADRLPREKSLLGRSRCDSCGRKLEFLDLVPVLSSLFLKGKCRTCGQKFSWRYFWTEFSLGAMFCLILWKFAGGFDLGELNGWNLFAICHMLYVTCLLFLIFLADFKHYIIPDEAIWAGAAGFLVYEFFRIFGIGYLSFIENWKFELGNFLLASLVSGGFFLALVLISHGRWMGFGDVKLAFLMGLWLGWPNILISLFLAFLSGSVVGITLIFAGKKTMKSQVPFGTFLSASTFVILLWGGEILRWYLGILG